MEWGLPRNLLSRQLPSVRRERGREITKIMNAVKTTFRKRWLEERKRYRRGSGMKKEGGASEKDYVHCDGRVG